MHGFLFDVPWCRLSKTNNAAVATYKVQGQTLFFAFSVAILPFNVFSEVTGSVDNWSLQFVNLQSVDSAATRMLAYDSIHTQDKESPYTEEPELYLFCDEVLSIKNSVILSKKFHPQ